MEVIEINIDKEFIISTIKSVLDIDKIYVCYLFGSFGTEDFNEFSDIDIAVITDLNFCQLGLLEGELSVKLGRDVDLVDANKLSGIFKLQIAYRSDIVFCKDEEKLDKFLEDTDYWYKTDYRLWKAWQESEW